MLWRTHRKHAFDSTSRDPHHASMTAPVMGFTRCSRLIDKITTGHCLPRTAYATKTLAVVQTHIAVPKGLGVETRAAPVHYSSKPRAACTFGSPPQEAEMRHHGRHPRVSTMYNGSVARCHTIKSRQRLALSNDSTTKPSWAYCTN